MALVVEGSDGSGKSFLIEQLKHSRVHLTSMRAGVGGPGWAAPHETVVMAYRRKIIGATLRPGLGAPIAFDRFHVSEWVYGPILRDVQLIGESVRFQIEDALAARGVKTILCLPPFEETMRNVAQGGRERPSYQTPDFLRAAYNRFLEASQLFDVEVYDYTRDPLPSPADPVLR